MQVMLGAAESKALKQDPQLMQGRFLLFPRLETLAGEGGKKAEVCGELLSVALEIVPSRRTVRE